MFEGQEEVASPDMPKFVFENKEKLSCDMIFSADGGQFSETEPNLVVGLKGILGLEIKVKGRGWRQSTEGGRRLRFDAPAVTGDKMWYK